MRPVTFLFASFFLAFLGSVVVTAVGQPAKLRVEEAANPGKLNLKHETSFVVFPEHCNPNQLLFGGKVLAEMDKAAAVTVRRLLYASPAGTRDAVTVAVDGVKFHKAGEPKDLVYLTGSVVELGRKSVTVQVDVERERVGLRELLAEGRFVFVAYDVAAKKAVEHGIVLPKGD